MIYVTNLTVGACAKFRSPVIRPKHCGFSHLLHVFDLQLIVNASVSVCFVLVCDLRLVLHLLYAGESHTHHVLLCRWKAGYTESFLHLQNRCRVAFQHNEKKGYHHGETSILYIVINTTLICSILLTFLHVSMHSNQRSIYSMVLVQSYTLIHTYIQVHNIISFSYCFIYLITCWGHITTTCGWRGLFISHTSSIGFNFIQRWNYKTQITKKNTEFQWS